jgi:hypothetical protein
MQLGRPWRQNELRAGVPDPESRLRSFVRQGGLLANATAVCSPGSEKCHRINSSFARTGCLSGADRAYYLAIRGRCYAAWLAPPCCCRRRITCMPYPNSSVISAGLNGMAPAKDMGVAQIAQGAGRPAGLDQCGELEIDRVHVRRPSGEMAKTPIGVAAGKRPVGCPVDGGPHSLSVAAQLPQDKHSVEAGMNVPVRLLEVPAAIGLLVV